VLYFSRKNDGPISIHSKNHSTEKSFPKMFFLKRDSISKSNEIKRIRKEKETKISKIERNKKEKQIEKKRGREVNRKNEIEK